MARPHAPKEPESVWVVPTVVVLILLVLSFALSVTRNLRATDPLVVPQEPRPSAMWFSPTGELILVSERPAEVVVTAWEPETRAARSFSFAIDGSSSPPYAVARDGSSIVRSSSGPDGSMLVVIEAAGGERKRATIDTGAAVRRLAFVSEDTIALLRDDGAFQLWDLTAGKLRSGRNRFEPASSFLFDGRYLLVLSLDSGDFAVSDVAELPVLTFRSYPYLEVTGLSAAAVTRSGDPVVSTLEGSILRRHAVGDWRPLPTMEGTVEVMAPLEDDTVLVAGDFPGVHLLARSGTSSVFIDEKRAVRRIAVGPGHLAIHAGDQVFAYTLNRGWSLKEFARGPFVWLAFVTSLAAVWTLLWKLMQWLNRRSTSAVERAAPGEAAETSGRRSALEVGSRLGDYEIRGLLGRGAMGEVYEAYDSGLHRLVAIKVLPQHLLRESRALRRFEEEAKTLAALSHRNILTIYQIGRARGLTFAVTEKLDGHTLRRQLAGGEMPVRSVLEIAGSIGRGLAAAHARGIIHRDIKPENVFLTSDSGVKILDFGLARRPTGDFAKRPEPPAETTDTLTWGTLPGSFVGTPGYIAPEQLRGVRADARSDIFSLGCVVYEMLVGRAPFARATPADTLLAVLSDQPAPIDPGPSEALNAIVALTFRCLSRDPEMRPRSASDLVSEIERILNVLQS